MCIYIYIYIFLESDKYIYIYIYIRPYTITKSFTQIERVCLRQTSKTCNQCISNSFRVRVAGKVYIRPSLLPSRFSKFLILFGDGLDHSSTELL